MNALEQPFRSRFSNGLFDRSCEAWSGAGQIAMKNLDGFGRAVGGLLLIGSPRAGFLLAAAIAVEPRLLLGAIIGLLTATASLSALGVGDPYRAANIRVNAILAGLAAAWLAGSALLPLHVAASLIVLSAGAASILAAALSRALIATHVPPLSAAFVLVFGVLLTFLPHLATAAVLAEEVWPYPVGFAGWIDSFLRSMGMIVFSPRPETGLLVITALGLWSGLFLLHGLAGWAVGIATSMVLAKFGVYWLWLLSAHNGFVAAMLLGAVFHMPGRAGLAASALAGAVAAVLALFVQTGFGGTAWAFQPLPALLTVWIALLALAGRQEGHPLVSNTRTCLPPQQAWREWRVAAVRFGNPQPLICVPLGGIAAITQSFDGPLSHRGLWRHALDFEYPAQPGAATATIFGAPVYCPAAGVVESVCADIADNALGRSNYSQNWGNHIILRMDQGGWLMLAHLAQYSIAVLAGQRVRLGEIVAAVGNSGRSPVPHLHMHVQASALPGSPTVPFRLANYVAESGEGGFWVSGGVPDAGTLVSAALPNAQSFHAATSLAPGEGLWRISIQDKVPSRYAKIPRSARLATSLDPTGNHVISDGCGGRLQLRADADALRVHNYRAGGQLLRLLMLGLPVLPYRATPGLVWRDHIDLPAAGLIGHIQTLLAPYANWYPPSVQLKCLQIPENAGQEIVVETQVIERNAADPFRIVTRLAAVKGPVELEAHFETGSIVAQLIGFDPGLREIGAKLPAADGFNAG